MKKLLLLSLLSLALPLSLSAQVESFEQILQRAKYTNKPILLKFTGSDWCPPCKRLDKEVFSTSEFQKYADQNLIFLVLDFPRGRTLPREEAIRNEQLAARFNVRGFPTLILLSPDGRELAREVGYLPGGVGAFLQWLSHSLKDKNNPS